MGIRQMISESSMSDQRLATKATRLATVVLGGALLCGTLFSTQASFGDERAEYVTATRQGALKLMGFYMGPLGGMARGKIPMDAGLVGRNAQRIGALAPMLTDTFKLNTSEFELTTEALPVIWENPAEFQAKIETLVERAADLSRLAETGSSEGALKGGIGKLGQACGSCHDDFRVKDE